MYQDVISDEKTPPGMAILADSAFVTSTKATNGKLMKARKTNETQDLPKSVPLSAIDVVLQRIYPRERQSAEWAVRAITSIFPRLKVQILADSLKRLRLIQTCCHLYNFHTRFAGLNKI